MARWGRIVKHLVSNLLAASMGQARTILAEYEIVLVQALGRELVFPISQVGQAGAPI